MLPRGVDFHSFACRINIRALAPYRARSTQRAWEFSDDDIQAFRDELKKRSLGIASHWQHEDGGLPGVRRPRLKRALRVRGGQSVLIDNGTTTLAVARELAGAGVTALALSLHAAASLASRPGNEVIVPGGTIAGDDLSFTGIGAVETIRAMRFDIAFIGACSADPAHGLTVATWPDAQIKRAALESSARTVLVTTAAKFSRTSAHRFGSYGDLDTIITTADAPVSAIYEARQAGVEVITVPLSAIPDH